MEPSEAALLALRGLVRGEFLIFSHSETEARLNERSSMVNRGFDLLRNVLPS